MKIAFAIEHFDVQHGGAEQYAWGLAQWLTAQKHTLDIYTLHGPAQDIPPMQIHTMDIRHHRGHCRPLRFAQALSAAWSKQTYDVIQGFNHAWPCDVLRLGGGVHLAFEKYNLKSVRGAPRRFFKRITQGLAPKYRALRTNELAQFSHPRRWFIAISERVAQDMRHYYPGVSERIQLIRNAVDTHRFNPDACAVRRARARETLDIDPDALVLLFMSNNFRLKGLYDLLDAMAVLSHAGGPSFELLVAGRCSSRLFEAHARVLGVEDRVHFRGPLPDSLDGYAAADLLVHPSYYDAYGFVGLEAMACGLPVVMSTNAGVSEIMADGNGAVLIPMPCSSIELADAITQAAEPDFRTQARECNPAIARKYPLEKNYEQVMALYQAVCRC
jgi:UDP-glucose:(heptosyl)LPS alpha-1,3-glucosyltransferase